MAAGSFATASWSERSVFFLYMALWLAYGLLNQRAKLKRESFDPTTVVYVQECLKLTISIALFHFQDGGLKRLVRTGMENWSMFLWYLIPAGLYALTDVLMYVNIRSFDPATYYLLSEMKLVLTAVVSRALFGRKLNGWHWASLGLISGGCALKTLDSLDGGTRRLVGAEDGGHQDDGVADQIIYTDPNLANYLILLLQILASTTAGVYNEKLLKTRDFIPVNLQNIYLYVDGILLLVIGFATGVTRSDEQESLADAISPSKLRDLFVRYPMVLVMACLMSVAGIVTGRFLKIFDSVLKSIALSLVVATMPFMSMLCFGTAVTTKMVVAIVCVVVGMHVYSSQPAPSEDSGEKDLALEHEGGNEVESFLPEDVDESMKEEDTEMQLTSAGADGA